MKKLIFILLLFISGYSQAQTLRANEVIADKNLYPGLYDTLVAPGRVGNLRVRVQDTSLYMAISMTAPKKWQKILKLTDVVATDISGKLNISDSAGMLAPYIHNGLYGLLKSGQRLYLDSALVFPQIRATIPGQTYPGSGIPNSTGSAWGTSYSTTGTGSLVALQTSPDFLGTVTGVASTWSGLLTANKGHFNSNTASNSHMLSLTDNNNGTAWMGWATPSATVGFWIGSNNAMTIGTGAAANTVPTYNAITILNTGDNALTFKARVANSAIQFTDATNATVRFQFPATSQAAITKISSHRLIIGTSAGGGAAVTPNLTIFETTGNVGVNATSDGGSNFNVTGTALISTSLTTPLLIGGTGIGGTLTLQSTSNATKGNILFGTSAYDEVNNRLIIGATSGTNQLTVASNVAASANTGLKVLNNHASGYANITIANNIGEAQIYYPGSTGSTPNILQFYNPSANGFAFSEKVSIATSTTTPLLIGGTAATSPITIQSSSNAGATTGADIIFKPGATETFRIKNDGTSVFASTVLFGSNNVYDIGNNAYTASPRRIYVAGFIMNPLYIGGNATTSSISYQTTTGIGATGADHIFLVGNNGATEAMRILNSGLIQANIPSAGFGFLINGATTKWPAFTMQLSGVTKSILGVASQVGEIVTGSAINDVILRTQGGSLIFTTNSGSSINWYINSSGHFLAGADNTYDIGAAIGTTAPRTVYASTSVKAPLLWGFNQTLSATVLQTSSNGSAGWKIENAGGGNGYQTMTGHSVNTATIKFSPTSNKVSTSAILLSDSWYAAGTSTTTKPQLLIEPTETTSTAWSTSGTGIGVNAASGFAGNLLDLQLVGVSKFSVTSAGRVNMPANQKLNWSGDDGFRSNGAGTITAHLAGSDYYAFTTSGFTSPKYFVSALNTAPASAAATGTTGEIRFVADFIYVCIATNTWVRTALATW